ncbi:MAG: GNAT family acetyltransferase [Sulfurospirillaceae bacterium]|nr:GNAT family acetyltransferase [Sulfurospirillaceae bacterium]
MKLKIAELSDIDKVLELHFRYQVDSIDENDKKDGFVTTPFTKKQLSELIEQEQGLFIAIKDDEVVAYVMAASWQFWSKWPMFAYMIEDLPNLEFLGQRLSVDNSYQYGPICIDKSVRGSGMLEMIFDFAREEMSKRYPILVTFINKINPRSFAAHTKKLGLTVIQEFSYNNNNYFELLYDTAIAIKKKTKIQKN